MDQGNRRMTTNADVAAFFAPLSAHSDVALALETALKPLGDYRIAFMDRQFGALYALTEDTIFCAASGMNHTFFRLRPADIDTALATGAEPCGVGPEWVRMVLFRNDWPAPDLRFWALRAYDFAKTGK
jgi:hypothetical protein